MNPQKKLVCINLNFLFYSKKGKRQIHFVYICRHTIKKSESMKHVLTAADTAPETVMSHSSKSRTILQQWQGPEHRDKSSNSCSSRSPKLKTIAQQGLSLPRVSEALSTTPQPVLKTTRGIIK